MSKRPLTIHVEPDAAEVYEAAAPGDREALDQMMSTQLLRYSSQTNPPDHAGTNAEASDTSSKPLAGSGTGPGHLDREERLKRLRAACGIWEGRTDLPTRDDSRAEWEERLQRLGLGD